MSTAKKIRLSKILHPTSNRAIIVPIDHGLTMGPLPGLESAKAMGQWLANDRIDAIIAHKGMIARLADLDLIKRRGVILHLNGMNSLASSVNDKVMLTSLEAAARLGVDAVSMQINFTGENDAANWQALGRAIDEAQIYGFPFLTMLYDKVVSADSEHATARLRQLLRVAVELGSDAIKIGMPETREALAKVLENLSDDALIFLAGGKVMPCEKLLSQINQAIDLGSAGVCIGRNVFSAPAPDAFLRKLSGVVHRETRAVHREVENVI